MQTRFPSGVACFLCFAPYGPPFNHEFPRPGTRYKGEFCDYPDVLKELTYVIYQNKRAREAVFVKLGHPVPTTLTLYWRFLGKRRGGDLLGLYEVLVAYLDVKETAGFNDEIVAH
jgi:hypothetical protein